MNTDNGGNTGNPDRQERSRHRRPRRSVIWGVIVGASFTLGYLINSFFYCQAQFSCSVSTFWLIALALIGASLGALFGWTAGKFLNFVYRVTRVD